MCVARHNPFWHRHRNHISKFQIFSRALPPQGATHVVTLWCASALLSVCLTNHPPPKKKHDIEYEGSDSIYTFSNFSANAKHNTKQKTLPLHLHWPITPVCSASFHKQNCYFFLLYLRTQGHAQYFLLRFASKLLKVSNFLTPFALTCVCRSVGG